MKNTLKFWQVDAFTNQLFKGNPAAVFVVETPLSKELMQNIAVEMNLSETAFIEFRKSQNPLIRWFTPNEEIDLCGHATLASAHIIFNKISTSLNEIIFDTKYVGALEVKKNLIDYTMNFPSRVGKKLELNEISEFILNGLTTAKPVEAYKARDLMLVYEDAQIIYNVKPNFNLLAGYKDPIIVTASAQDSQYDFISRFFCTNLGITEDPVTGSAHCTLVPYWANKFNKTELKAYQASKRGGELILKLEDNSVYITGEAITVLEGKLKI